MDAAAAIPPRLRPPGGGERVRLGWTADLGPSRRVGDLAEHLRALDTVVRTGERWGVEFGRAAARVGLINRLGREGPEAIDVALRDAGFGPRETRYLDEWLHGGWWGPSLRRFPFASPGELLDTLADVEVDPLLGAPTDVEHLEYRNPIEVVLGGSGFLLFGVIFALRFVRDFANARRVGAAEAHEAEAKAHREDVRTDLLRWLVGEVKAGRVVVSPGDLLRMVGDSDAKAITLLAQDDLTLELPAGASDVGPT